MRQKNYPKSKKKTEAQPKVDNRPHVNQYPKYDTKATKEERKFCIPDIRHRGSIARDPDSTWDKNEIHALIDMWAEISWGKHSSSHRTMSGMSGYFQKLWNKQNGRCAISGVQLFGAPGCIGHGIGIDIINHKFGVRKGNIRLTSAPIAITRVLYPRARDQVIDNLDPKDYKEWPIFWAVLKHIQWWLKKERPFRWLPVQVHFGEPNLLHSDIGWTRMDWITFHWGIRYPDNNTIKAWKESELSGRDSKFCSVRFNGDCLYLSTVKYTGSSRNPCREYYDFLHDMQPHSNILLSDPNVHIEKRVVEVAKIGFATLGRFLGTLDKK